MIVHKWNRLGIARQLSLLVAVIFVPMAAFLTLYIRWEYQQAVAEASRQAFRHAQTVAVRTEHFHRQSFAILEGLARRPAIQAMATAPCDPVFDHFLAANKSYANLLLDNAAGDVVCNAAQGPNLKGLVTHRPWFRAIMASGVRQVGDPTVGRVVGRWISALAEPVVDAAGIVRGVLVLTVDLWNYQFNLDRDLEGSAYVVTVLDSQRAVVARSRDADQWVGKKLQLPVEAIRSIKPGDTAFIADAEGTLRLYGHAPVAGTDWLVVVDAPRQALWAEIGGHVALELAFAVAVVVVLGFAAFFIARRIREPVEAVARAAEALGEGRFDVRLPEEAGNLELAVLAQKFNRMAELRQTAQTRLAEVLDLNSKILATSPIGIAAYREDGPCVLVNEHAAKLAAAAPEWALGQDFRKAACWQQSGMRLAAEQALATGQTQQGEFHVVAASGREAWLDCGFSAFEANGQRHLLVVAEDVTERKQAEMALARAHGELERRVAERTAELQAANRELESFSYTVAHDLRAPLRSIDGFSHLLEERCGAGADAEAREYIQRVRGAAGRMGRLIDDMLELARLSRVELNRETVDLSAMAREIAGELAEQEPQRQAEVCIAAGVTAVGDPPLLRALLQNLLDNAWKYTAKHPTARIEFGSRRLEDGRLAYFVKDDGAGFDMAHANKLFGLFQRLHHPKDFDGTGVGLATVQRIVERHGGEIWAEGAVEQGATFSFTLPGRASPL